ncbi:MAG: PQQ-dependent sugar dehydrogenase [Hymenobacteraceae bacterium]|nr:PQQ-dependent sugar dehydrogenase [Hymenobacteraceae bacterium]MDX5482434.1 PQQ-dependent sugar dehydrogenase [Hymenobacteraceae bacterium]
MKTSGENFLTHYARCTAAVLGFLFLAGPACSQKSSVVTDAGSVKVETLADNLTHPWGMAFLPDNRLLVTERAGDLRILDTNNNLSEPLSGVPEVFAEGQGGLLDVALDPDFQQNNLVYLSFAEPGENNTASTALGRGRLEGNAIKDFQVIFRQEPKVEGPNHFGGRIVFTPEGQIFLALGERFKFDPAQDLSNHMGTIVRINRDGSVPQDNPFVGQQNAKDEIWSYGHRNIESAAIEPGTNRLWVAEMGPMGGDELNQPEAGKNYGWPVVSWGDNYDGSQIPDPPTHPEFADAVIKWTPTISPSGMIFYSGSMYPAWQGTALIGGLTSTGIVRVRINGNQAEEVERIPLAVRTRDVEQAPDGSVYVLTDESNGKILRLVPMK